MWKLALFAVLLLAATLGDWVETWFAPDAEPWPRWRAHDPASSAVIGHGAWQRFLDAYLSAGADGINRVAYARVTAADRRALDAYLERLQDIAISGHSRAEQRAYWINLYNALTVRLVLAHYPVESIRDIDSPGLLSIGPWDRELARVEGEALSLNDIEHRILRPLWGDPRIHYALNCAAVGCPNLQPAAFTGANAERLLDAGARAFINHRRGVRREDGALVVSSLYNWFAADFGGEDAAVIAHLRRYAEPPLAARLAGARRIDGYAYDWRLNDASAP